MDLGEARAKMVEVVKEIQDAGFRVWGWDDESIMIGHDDGLGIVTWVDPRDLSDMPSGTPPRHGSG